VGHLEGALGNVNLGIELLERSQSLHKSTGTYNNLAYLNFEIGDYNSGQEYTKKGIRLCNELIRKGKRGWPEIQRDTMQAQLLEVKGQFAEAEPYRRSILKNMEKYGTMYDSPKGYISHRSRLGLNLAAQGRLIEAELEARKALKQALGFASKESAITARAIGVLGKILLTQGRFKDAEKLAYSRIRIYEAISASDDSNIVMEARMFWGQVAVSRLDFTEAMRRFDRTKEDLLGNQNAYGTFFARNPNVLMSLLKTGRSEEAMDSISAVYEEYSEFVGRRNYLTAEMLGLRGMANAMMKNEKQALKDFSESVPILVRDRTAAASDYLKKQRFRIIIEAYLDLLTRIHKGGLEKESEVSVSAESFKLVQAMRQSTVQSALGASGARAAAVDPDLADLVRREQDAFKQINALQTTLLNVSAAPPDQLKPEAIKDLKARIDTLSNARSALLDEIKRRFPKYADFTNPQFVTFSVVQKHLRPGEALIAIYPADDRTYVWAIPSKSEAQFEVVSLGEKELEKTAATLRKALDPRPGTFGDIPEFNTSQAFALYNKLLKPVEDGWEGETDLLIVAHGPLGQLPFSVLPTAPISQSREKGELFSKYKHAPWLIRKVSITRLPSVSSFVTLRTLPEGDPARKAFVGFGDPFFNQDQLARAKEEKVSDKIVLASRETTMRVRGLRITEAGDLDSDKITSSHLGLLNRLPDTEEEIKSIAQALGADPDQDILLGKRASEYQVKTMNLSNRRVIAFATHALVPGDLDGLDQPAIALSAPSVTGDNEDGLLTMGEIVKLRLNADWVVLSACNTGAAYGEGAEAVSGLGRAFFYAGTRAMLLSMWPVETTSARKLTTGIFHYQREDRTLSRAKALQKSILELIDNQVLKDETTGKIVASYAHPFFWAPFIIVGDGG
jgi:CHAT domain-containing protein